MHTSASLEFEWFELSDFFRCHRNNLPVTCLELLVVLVAGESSRNTTAGAGTDAKAVQ